LLLTVNISGYHVRSGREALIYNALHKTH